LQDLEEQQQQNLDEQARLRREETERLEAERLQREEQQRQEAERQQQEAEQRQREEEQRRRIAAMAYNPNLTVFQALLQTIPLFDGTNRIQFEASVMNAMMAVGARFGSPLRAALDGVTQEHLVEDMNKGGQVLALIASRMAPQAQLAWITYLGANRAVPAEGPPGIEGYPFCWTNDGNTLLYGPIQLMTRLGHNQPI